MLSADKAREEVVINQVKRESLKIKSIERNIIDASRAGLYSVVVLINKDDFNFINKNLTELGYKITNMNPFTKESGINLRISWAS